ncbi:MAG TPA: hypothetical protein VMB03_28475 [Bryobacteraceae bacterium]|nr:hypothetical protein [Bryobacteraceae bacterium]
MDTIEIADFPAEGVTLIPVAAGDFYDRAEAILGDHAPPALDLAPYLAIVRNQNRRTVVAYTIAWTVTLRNNMSRVKYTQYKFPDAVGGASGGFSMLEGREIRTGEQRLHGLGFELWPPQHALAFRDYGISEAREFGAVTRIEVALDAVIFDDGALLGPDRSHLAEHFIEFVRAKQSAYGDILEALESGAVEDALAPLRAIASSTPPGLAIDPLGIYSRMAAEEILAFNRRVALEAFRRTIRRDPFSIRRLSETSG